MVKYKKIIASALVSEDDYKLLKKQARKNNETIRDYANTLLDFAIEHELVRLVSEEDK